jgi:hypothetical protein
MKELDQLPRRLFGVSAPELSAGKLAKVPILLII